MDSFILKKHDSPRLEVDVEEEVEVVPLHQIPQASLLLNSHFIDFVKNAGCVCGLCKWTSCWVVPNQHSGTNTLFRMRCVCGIERTVSTQGADSPLNEAVHTATRLTGNSPTKVRQLSHLIGTNFPAGNQQYSHTLTEKVVPAVEKAYEAKRAEVIELTKQAIAGDDLSGATVAWDTGYSSRNNNANFASSAFLEKITGFNYCLHVEMVKCSDSVKPQGAEAVATRKAMQTSCCAD